MQTLFARMESTVRLAIAAAFDCRACQMLPDQRRDTRVSRPTCAPRAKLPLSVRTHTLEPSKLGNRASDMQLDEEVHQAKAKLNWIKAVRPMSSTQVGLPHPISLHLPPVFLISRSTCLPSSLILASLPSCLASAPAHRAFVLQLDPGRSLTHFTSPTHIQSCLVSSDSSTHVPSADNRPSARV